MTRLPSSPLPWLIALAASVAAAFVLLYYVQLLQDVVARGSQFKYVQANHEPGTKVAVRNLVSAAR